ncbi:aminotransferase class IV [Actinoplanes subtropicus]|uniref:aminotransferase class IV n=1 Tax=Actinoplanes subtropicus TaxID=543632 RepID=UPI00068E6D33|nr:aminotransferase class IV [Actinoplanes subtropicus]
MLAWVDGVLVPEEEVTLPVNSVTAALGIGFFEALRCYPGPDGVQRAFRPGLHHVRLRRSLSVVGTAVPLTLPELLAGIADVVAGNDIGAEPVYLKVMVCWDTVLQGSSLVRLDELRPRVILFARATDRQVFADGPATVRCRLSSWTRVPGASMPAEAKATANYFNARLGLTEALAGGYDNAIFVDGNGHLTEAAEANIFVVSHDSRTIATPPVSSGILPGVTRASVLSLLRAHFTDWDVVERPLTRVDLYAADEAFLTNTAQLIRQVGAVDGHTYRTGTSTVTARIRRCLIDVLFQRVTSPPDWLTDIPTLAGGS